MSLTPNAFAAGGLGGGGRGFGNNGEFFTNKPHGEHAQPNTGGGGGGVRDRYNDVNDYTSAGNGGSGIVIVRYPKPNTINEPAGLIQATGGTISYAFESGSVYKIHKFTNEGTFTFSVTNVGQFGQDLRFATTANSTFNSVSKTRGVLKTQTGSYSVVVGTNGSVSIAYPLSPLPNVISPSSINPNIPIVATGGLESTISVNGISYRLHQFINVGTDSFTVTHEGTILDGGVEYLVIGGGGGGTYGGGGGGGYRCSVNGELSGRRTLAEPRLIVKEKTYTIGVGSGGGSLGTQLVPENNNPFRGNPSFIGNEVIALGGGGGYVFPAPQRSAGSGGSGAGTQYSLANGGVVGRGQLGQGFDGGIGVDGVSSFTTGGGGGGAGQAGLPGNSTSSGGNGGAGIPSSITGTTVIRAGGGGGATNGSNGLSVGGAGGGGRGGSNSAPSGVSGTPNTGGGAGGSRNEPSQQVSGGSGIVIIRYPLEPTNL
jgi:hypothetical protein